MRKVGVKNYFPNSLEIKATPREMIETQAHGTKADRCHAADGGRVEDAAGQRDAGGVCLGALRGRGVKKGG